MNRKLGRFLLAPAVAVTIFSAAAFSGCKTLEKAYVDSDGNLIYEYSDGTSESLGNVKGASSTDVTDSNTKITVSDMYEKYKEIYGDIEYSDFLKIYLNSDSASTGETSATAINSALLSSATVHAFFTETTTYSYGGWFGGYNKTQKETKHYSGSSVIYRMDKDYTYLITNYHVIYDYKSETKTPEKVYIYLYGSESEPVASSTNSDGTTNYTVDDYAVSAEYIGGAITADIALLRVKTEDVKSINPSAKPVTVGDGYYVGETAIAIGNTEGEGISVTKGIISVDNDNIVLDIDGTSRYYRSIRIDTAIYSGNSGGGLFNNSGELIGITNAGDSTDQNINYAVPLNIATGVADSVLYYMEQGVSQPVSVYRPQIGITVSEENVRYTYDAESERGRTVSDITVSTVTNGSIASTLGIEDGDIITSMTVNGEPKTLYRSYDIDDLLYTVRVGDKISFGYTRDAQEMETADYTILSTDLKAVS